MKRKRSHNMNLLQHETSPYLLQHKDNPVDWMPWGASALERARLEEKPILLSIGYSACHWCHVMAHESFKDPTTAALMNQNFINIKLDREERPDIDALYQNALSLMGKQGGWPLTIFLTPAGEPFWGGTYFPPQPRYGMPSFREVLRGIAESYAQDKDKITHNVRNLATALTKLNTGQQGHIISRIALDKITGSFLSLIDPAHGGIGTAPKFPNFTILTLLWNSYIRTGEERYKSAVIHSLTQICQGGIYDHIGGGIARYAVDAEWLVPHFEKMLYDNAQLISLLCEVCKETQNPLFVRRLAETIGWVMEDLAIQHNGHIAFTASLDADSEHVEGKYYIWGSDEIDGILGTEAEAFKKTYDVTRFGNWEGVNILNRLQTPDYHTEEEETQLAALREKLKLVRRRRVPPQRDDKVLADSNGLMITALARAGAAFDRPEWTEAAESAFHFVTSCMMDKTGRLSHSWCKGMAKPAVVLEDYTNMMEAALALHEAIQKMEYLEQAVTWMGILDKEFLDKEKDGYFMSPAQADDLLLRPKSAYDSAVPSGNGTMVGVLARLYQLTGVSSYITCAEKTAEAFSGEIIHHAFPFATLLGNTDALLNPNSIVIVLPQGTDKSSTIFDAALKNISLPSLVKTVVTTNKSLPENHPAFGKGLQNGKTAAYLCFGRQCSAPMSTAAELEHLLRQEREKYRHLIANDG
jgi:uncharacterized protein YyaL (SSP411 family)